MTGAEIARIQADIDQDKAELRELMIEAENMCQQYHKHPTAIKELLDLCESAHDEAVLETPKILTLAAKIGLLEYALEIVQEPELDP